MVHSSGTSSETSKTIHRFKYVNCFRSFWTCTTRVNHNKHFVFLVITSSNCVSIIIV
jgi:hypothetical protein